MWRTTAPPPSLLHPVVVSPGRRLVAGRRRLEAAKRLGWAEVPATVAATLDDVRKCLLAEQHENTCRKDFTPTEAVMMATALMPFEEKAAEERKAAPNAEREKFSPSEKGVAKAKVAALVGMSRPTLAKATAVVEAAEPCGLVGLLFPRMREGDEHQGQTQHDQHSDGPRNRKTLAHAIRYPVRHKETPGKKAASCTRVGGESTAVDCATSLQQAVFPESLDHDYAHRC